MVSRPDSSCKTKATADAATRHHISNDGAFELALERPAKLSAGAVVK